MKDESIDLGKRFRWVKNGDTGRMVLWNENTIVGSVTINKEDGHVYGKVGSRNVYHGDCTLSAIEKVERIAKEQS